jgi:hypothetical protein
MSKPFEVEIDCGSATPVRFTLDEKRLREAGIKVQYALVDDTGDPDERTRLWRVALSVIRNLVKSNDERPIEVYDW